MASLPRRYKWFMVFGVITFALDQLTKYWARNDLPTDARGFGVPVSVIENFWDWRLSYNTGSAFGMFSNVTYARIFLTVVGLVALGAILWMVHKAKDDQRRLAVGLGLVGGGAIGNVVDRVMFGKVTDFVVWRWHEHEWPTFNVADAALCIGVGLLFLDLGKQSKLEKAAKAAAAKENRQDAKGAKKKKK